VNAQVAVRVADATAGGSRYRHRTLIVWALLARRDVLRGHEETQTTTSGVAFIVG
jgi:hypothetical protein